MENRTYTAGYFDEGSWNDAIALAAKVVIGMNHIDESIRYAIKDEIRKHFISHPCEEKPAI